MSDDKKYGRLIKNSGKGVPRRERRDVRREASKAFRSKREFDKRALGGDENIAKMNELYSKYMDMQWDMVSFHGDGELWLNMRDADHRTKRQRINSQMFQQRAVFECFDQLRGGLTAENIVACVGMYVGMSMMNPEIRKSSQKMASAAFGSAVEFMESHPERGFLGMRGAMLNQFTKKRDKYMLAANDGRMPFTAETAALTSIRLDREYYQAERAGDPEAMDKYTKAQQTLNDVCGFDGVELSDMNKAKRIIIGKWMSDDKNPERASEMERMYVESDVTGGWQKAEAKPERVLELDDEGNPRVVTKNVWTGEFMGVDADGITPMDIPDDASFTVRKPYTYKDVARHVSAIFSEYSNMYGPGEKSLNELAANMQLMGNAAVDNMTGSRITNREKAVRFRAGITDKEEWNGIMSKVMGAYKSVMDRADEDYNIGACSQDGRMKHASELSASVSLGVLSGTVSEQMGQMFEKYNATGVKNEAILTRRTVEMSSVACEYVRMCGGVDPMNPDFVAGADELAAHYAAVCLADTLDSSKNVDFSDGKFYEAVMAVTKDDPDAMAAYGRIASEMSSMIQTYGTVYSGAIAHCGSVGYADEMMDFGFEQAVERHMHAHDHIYVSDSKGSAEEKAKHDFLTRQAVTADAEEWGRTFAKTMLNFDEFSKSVDKARASMTRDIMDQRAARVDDIAYGPLGKDGSDGPSYGE